MDVYRLETENGVQYAYDSFFDKLGLKAFRKGVEYYGREPLADDEYPKHLFRNPIIVAHVVRVGDSIPATPTPDRIEYIGDKR